MKRSQAPPPDQTRRGPVKCNNAFPANREGVFILGFRNPAYGGKVWAIKRERREDALVKTCRSGERTG